MRTVNESVKRDDNDEAGVFIISIDMSARERRALRSTKARRAFIKEMIDNEVTYPIRCRCSHCMNDWDCCGNFFGYTPHIVPRRGGIKIVQHIARNI